MDLYNLSSIIQDLEIEPQERSSSVYETPIISIGQLEDQEDKQRKIVTLLYKRKCF